MTRNASDKDARLDGFCKKSPGSREGEKSRSAEEVSGWSGLGLGKAQSSRGGHEESQTPGGKDLGRADLEIPRSARDDSLKPLRLSALDRLFAPTAYAPGTPSLTSSYRLSFR